MKIGAGMTRKRAKPVSSHLPLYKREELPSLAKRGGGRFSEQ